MNKSKIDYNNITFNDPDDYAPDTDTCMNCMNETDERIGYNEKMDLLKRACSSCGLVYIEDGEGNRTIIKGEKRDWMAFLSKNLSFPFEANVIEYDGSDAEFFGFEPNSPFRLNDKVKVTKTNFNDENYGVIATIYKGRKKYDIPLCDLEVVDKASLNYKLVDDYKTWFVNYRDIE